MTMHEILNYAREVLMSKGIRMIEVEIDKMIELQEYLDEKKHLTNAKFLARKYIEKHF